VKSRWFHWKKIAAMLFPASEFDVLSIANGWRSRGHAVALATVVRISGSVPRQLGSHIAVRDDGAFAGSVSTGCLENEVIEQALATIADRRHRILAYSPNEGGVFESGLMCGGTIEIFVEPIL
jgi:xanthine dehydrogenase accessory factor